MCVLEVVLTVMRWQTCGSFGGTQSLTVAKHPAEKTTCFSFLCISYLRFYLRSADMKMCSERRGGGLEIDSDLLGDVLKLIAYCLF